MIELEEDEIPVLSKSMRVNNECVMIGIVEEGVIIYYTSLEKTFLVLWEEIITYGINVLKITEPSTRREIPSPKLKSSPSIVRVKGKRV